MRTRRFRPGLESLSTRIVPSDLGAVVGGIGNPMSPTDQQGLTSGDAQPGTLPLAPPYCGGGSTQTGSVTVITQTALVA
jgi:hypothetical protein